MFEFPLHKLHQFSVATNSSVIALHDIQDKARAARKFGVVEVDDNGKIIGFEEKPEFPKTSFVSTLCYVLRREDLGEIKNCMVEKQGVDNIGEFIRYLSDKKGVHAKVFSENWFDIGSHEELERVSEIYKE